MINFLYKTQYYWCSKHYDIPVEFYGGLIGNHNGMKFAEVIYEGKTSFIPYNELKCVRKFKWSK